MGVFRGKRKRGLFLSTKKKLSVPSSKRKAFNLPFCPQNTSTPNKTKVNKNFKRKLTISFTLTPRKSPVNKKVKFASPRTDIKEILQKNRKHVSGSIKRGLVYEQIEREDDKAEDTYLYSLEDRDVSGDACGETVDKSVDEEALSADFQETCLIKLICECAKNLKEHNLKEDFVTFLRLVADRKFPLDNVALLLFMDVVKWYNCRDIRGLRYNDTTLKFFWLGKKLFGGRFIRFMSGPKNETDVIHGKPSLSPTDSKINFACPSEEVLCNYNPVGYEMEYTSGPGVVKTMVDLILKNADSEKSYVLMYDGKKIKRGADIDLLGFEKDPAREKKEMFETDTTDINKTLEFIRCMNSDLESNPTLDEDKKKELCMLIRQCFQIFSNCLKKLRAMRTAKQYALENFKTKIKKDPSLTKNYQFALDTCRTSIYLVDNCITDLLEVQWAVCKAGAFLNGAINLFAKSKIVNLHTQGNAKLLKDVNEMKADLQVEELPTDKTKQRSEEWFKARESSKVTASVLYNAVGCDGLKKQNEHFDHVFKSIKKAEPNEIQRQAMEHGIESEIHEIATLTGIILPFMFPDLIYQEEGYYALEGVIVSPDGTLRKRTSSSVVYAVEGKAPVGNKYCTTQHYHVPDRYILQTVYEQKATKAIGTIYLCWTRESTTGFIVPMNNDIYERTQRLVADLYLGEVPKRRTKISKESKDLKKEIHSHVTDCVYLGEFPSVLGVDTSSEADTVTTSFEFDILYRSLLKGKTLLRDAYNLQRAYASQVLVYLVSDLDRMWKAEMPHAVPVMYAYRGYSLSQEIARQLITHCRRACKGIDIVAIASDGEFIQQMVRGRKGQPLTLYQLSKDVWREVCSNKKTDLVKKIREINRTYRVSFGRDHCIFLDSADDCSGMKTPTNGWRDTKTRAHRKKNQSDDKTEEETGAPVSQTMAVFSDQTALTEGQIQADDNDETVIYDFEELLQETAEKHGPCNFPRSLNETEIAEILQMLNQRRPSKWLGTSQMDLSKILNNSLRTLIKDELTDIAKYLNLKLKGTSKELNVTRVKKLELIQQLGDLFGKHVTTEKLLKSRKRRNPKKLSDIAAQVLLKANYPKLVLNIAYANYIWPERVKDWRKRSKVAEKITVKAGNEDLTLEPYYVPEYDEEFEEFHVGIYDKTHLGTNLRKCLCLDKVKDVSIQAWRTVSQFWPDILHPSLIEVSEDGKILDQMKEKLAKSMLTRDVEGKMRTLDFQAEADFCRMIREGLYTADDTPGVNATDRCKMRLDLIQWLDKDVDFGRFPPYGGSIKGMSHILYEGLRTSQEGKLYLYALAKSGTYCVRSANTLCSESFFSTMQEMDPWGQGVLSSKGVEKHMSDFTTITALKMQEDRNIFIKTKKDTVYPSAGSGFSMEGLSDEPEEYPDSLCKCREEKFIKCIVPRNHFFDTPERARVKSKSDKVYTAAKISGELKGEQPIRLQYGYKINEAKLLPSHRLGLKHVLPDDEL